MLILRRINKRFLIIFLAVSQGRAPATGWLNNKRNKYWLHPITGTLKGRDRAMRHFSWRCSTLLAEFFIAVSQGRAPATGWLNNKRNNYWLHPITCTLKGRDRAILAVLLGCGLRSAEAAMLNFDRIQQRDGRWVPVDIIGKRNQG